MKPGFRHVVAIRSDCADRFWLIIDPTMSHTHIEMIPKVIHPDISEFIEGHVIEVEAIIDKECTNFTLCLNTCVDTVKRLLGIRSFFVFTPYQLYKRVK